MIDAGALYLDHARPLRAFVAARLRGVDDAAVDDLVADVFERVVRGAPAFRDRGFAPKAWLYRIASNLLVDRYRERSRKVQVTGFGELLPYVTHVGTSDHVERIDAQGAVAAALRELTEAQRAVIEARYTEGRTTPQTAEATGYSEESVKKLQRRALETLHWALIGTGVAT